MQSKAGNLSNNAVVGCLLGESDLGLSKLVEEIYDKLKGTEGVSVSSVRSSVLLIGQRMMYRQSSLDADVWEDESDAALWCWEVRGLKVMPVRTRGFLSTRRTATKKIHERITTIYWVSKILDQQRRSRYKRWRKTTKMLGLLRTWMILSREKTSLLMLVIHGETPLNPKYLCTVHE